MVLLNGKLISVFILRPGQLNSGNVQYFLHNLIRYQQRDNIIDIMQRYRHMIVYNMNQFNFYGTYDDLERTTETIQMEQIRSLDISNPFLTPKVVNDSLIIALSHIYCQIYKNSLLPTRNYVFQFLVGIQSDAHI